MRRERRRCGQLEALKRTIRAQLNYAASRGHLTGDEALALLLELGAEFVARVRDEGHCDRLTSDVMEIFPTMVAIEREVPPGVTWQ